MMIVAPSSSAPLASAPNTSMRPYPKVLRRFAGRAAPMAVASASEKASTSIQTCAASAASARLCEMYAPQNSMAATAHAGGRATNSRVRAFIIATSSSASQRFERQHDEHHAKRQERSRLGVLDDTRVPYAFAGACRVGARNDRRHAIAVAIEGFAELRTQIPLFVGNDDCVHRSHDAERSADQQNLREQQVLARKRNRETERGDEVPNVERIADVRIWPGGHEFRRGHDVAAGGDAGVPDGPTTNEFARNRDRQPECDSECTWRTEHGEQHRGNGEQRSAMFENECSHVVGLKVGHGATVLRAAS